MTPENELGSMDWRKVESLRELRAKAEQHLKHIGEKYNLYSSGTSKN